MGRKQLTPEQREAVYQQRLIKNREYIAQLRKDNPELCRERVRRSNAKRVQREAIQMLKEMSEQHLSIEPIDQVQTDEK